MRKIESRKRNFPRSQNWIFSFLFLLSIFESEKKISLLSIFESGKKNFSFYSRFPRALYWFSLIFGTPGSCDNGGFGWKQFICRCQVHLFFWNFFFFSQKIWYLFFSSRSSIRISNFSFYSWFYFGALVNAWFKCTLHGWENINPPWFCWLFFVAWLIPCCVSLS